MALKVCAFSMVQGLILALVSRMVKAGEDNARALHQRACYSSSSVPPSDLILTFCSCMWKGISPRGRNK